MRRSVGVDLGNHLQREWVPCSHPIWICRRIPLSYLQANSQRSLTISRLARRNGQQTFRQTTFRLKCFKGRRSSGGLTCRKQRSRDCTNQKRPNMPDQWIPPVPAWSADLGDRSSLAIAYYGVQHHTGDSRDSEASFALLRHGPDAPDYIERGRFND